MAPGKTAPVLVLLLGTGLAGCALSPLPPVRGELEAHDDAYLESLADIPLGELLNYQQQRYQLEDPLGDHALLKLLHLTATDVAWSTLTGQGYGGILREINELRGGFEFQPIELDRFAGIRGRIPEEIDRAYRQPWLRDDDVFTDVIAQEQQNGIAPAPGVCHRWSNAYRKNPQTGPLPYMFFSKLFWALAYGESSVYFVTGQEARLAQWIVDQEVRSVSLEALFRTSYRLNSGDAYLSLLTAANVFSRFWFFPDRGNLSIATQLELITAGHDGESDNFGAWHHFWGMALFGYCHGKRNARLVGWIESTGSHLVSERDESDEDYINRYAGEAGAELRKRIEHWPGERGEIPSRPTDRNDALFMIRR